MIGPRDREGANIFAKVGSGVTEKGQPGSEVFAVEEYVREEVYTTHIAPATADQGACRQCLVRVIVVADEGDDKVNQFDGELRSLKYILCAVAAIGLNEAF